MLTGKKTTFFFFWKSGHALTQLKNISDFLSYKHQIPQSRFQVFHNLLKTTFLAPFPPTQCCAGDLPGSHCLKDSICFFVCMLRSMLFLLLSVPFLAVITRENSRSLEVGLESSFSLSYIPIMQLSASSSVSPKGYVKTYCTYSLCKIPWHCLSLHFKQIQVLS